MRYAAYFDDAFAARMHAQTALRRRLVDVDAGLYRSSAVEAVAAVEGIALSHRRLFLDPVIAADPALREALGRRRRVHQRNERIWQGVGIAAIALLLLKLLLGF